MYRVSANLTQKSWENQLRMESRTGDIYSDFEGIFSEKKERLPGGIIAVAKLEPSKHSKVLGILKNLSGAGVTGRTVQLGNEIDQETKDIEVFSNDVSQAVNTERYGIDAHDKKAYNLLGAVQPQLSIWHKEIMGKYIREAMLERYSINLTVAPVSKTKRWNENILVTGVALTAQPAYNPTNATYEEALGDAIATMAANAWDVNLLGAIEYWITSVKKLEPTEKDRYIVSVPSNQAILLKDPSSSAAMAGLFKDSTIFEAANNAYRRYLGSFGRLDLFEDQRAPVIQRTGSNGSWNIAAYYKGAGDDDDRSGLSGTLVDVGFVHGKGAVIKAEHEALHFEDEVQNYGKIVGVGAFCGYGINRTVFEDSTSDTAPINQNSAAIFTARNTITA